MTQGEAEVGTSNVVIGQIYIAYTSAYSLIDFKASCSFFFLFSTSFIKKLDMVLELLDNVCKYFFVFRRKKLTSRFSFKVVPVKIFGREIPTNLIVLEMVRF